VSNLKALRIEADELLDERENLKHDLVLVQGVMEAAFIRRMLRENQQHLADIAERIDKAEADVRAANSIGFGSDRSY